MNKQLTFLLALTFLFLLSSASVAFADEFQDYQEALKWFRFSAAQGLAKAQYNLGVMYFNGQGVPQDYVLAHMWWNLSGSNEQKEAIENRNIVEERMSKQQIEKAREMARNWKPTKKDETNE